MIEASFFKQYGIRLRTVELDYQEFLNLLSCLMPDTPLGQIISIRSETNHETIKSFTKAQKAVRNEWLKKKYKEESKQEYAEMVDNLFRMALA